jgi:hypothetical protein
LVNTEVHSEADLLPPGAPEGTIPTDYNQSTGLERLEILGKMQGIDIFDMRPLPSDRVGMYKFNTSLCIWGWLWIRYVLEEQHQDDEFMITLWETR